MIPTQPEPANPVATKYYPFNEYSDNWHDWSVSLITCQTWYLAPIGLISLAASAAFRVIEAFFMLIPNSYLFIKYLFVNPAEQQPPAPPPQEPAGPPPPLQLRLPSTPILAAPPRLPDPVPQAPFVPLPVPVAQHNPPDIQRGCTTRLQAQATTHWTAIKENPKPALTVTAGVLTAGASIAFPALLPFAAGGVAAKFVWDALHRNKIN